jgi:radical SAM protein with 4Fe4S-binding SPASM domain
MKDIAYKKFSFNRHVANIGQGRPSLCQFEVTYRCGLHCTHCLTSCYNKPVYRKTELSVRQIELLFDRLRNAGVLWLCLTGGDPMARPDFPAIYQAARERGFLVTIFTSAFHLTPKIIDLLRRHPPFSVEVTMNAATFGVYDAVVSVKGAYARVKKNLRSLEAAGLPVKIKMQVTRQTIAGLTTVRRFARERGWAFDPSALLYPRLNGDPAPCSLRISPLMMRSRRGAARRGGCTVLFGCAATGGDGFYVDPSGNLFLCPLIRTDRINLLEQGIAAAVGRARRSLETQHFSRNAACRTCGSLHEDCVWCPGQAFLEAGDMEAPLPYYCATVGKRVQK